MITIIKIGEEVIDLKDIVNKFPINSTEVKILKNLSDSGSIYKYNSFLELKFEIDLRVNIIRAARELAKSGIKFKNYKESTCNLEFWERTRQGGFLLKKDVSPYEAIADIFKNGSKYGTECSTAIIIVYYGALLKMYTKKLFDSVFENIHLYDWHYIDSDLGVATKGISFDTIPGDCKYFKNPEFDPKTPEWRGENTIYLGDVNYYGHGIGIKTADEMIATLNKYRKTPDSPTAFLAKSVTNPNYKHLFKLQ